VVDSFWAVPDVATLRTPLSMLREQATALTEQTSGLLVGQVETNQNPDGNLLIQLEIVVPALNDFRVRILNYEQPIGLYPGRLTGMGIPVYETVNSEEDFVKFVRRALSSQVIKNVLTSLMSQVGDKSSTR
jgi:hypothetical protein